MMIIGILVAILPIADAAQAACPTLADAYQLQRGARVRDTTPEQLEIMQNAGLIVRAAAGFKTAVEELVCRGWSQSQIDDACAPHRRAASYPLDEAVVTVKLKHYRKSAGVDD